jgi:prepilin-type processing-associated H-X9-DG protein
MFFSRKAQAATEFAVLGSLIIVAFAFLINFSEKLNRQQAYIQQTFRAALKEARLANNSASYTKVAFRRMPNVSSPMELGQLQSFSNSANVLWADGKSTAAHGVSKYQLNEAAAIDIPYRATPTNTTEVNVNSFINNTNASTNLLKAEAGGIINTTKTLNAQDRLTADVTISGVPYNFEQELGDEGKYYPATGGITLQRSRDMQ